VKEKYFTSISGIVYPPISHWVWTEVGWLNRLGYVDFSGCGPVHLLGGVCSFFGALFLGPRLGRFESKHGDSEKEELVGHSIPVRTQPSAELQVNIIQYVYMNQRKLILFVLQFTGLF
jgi:ammonia channel protein AmtB